MSDEIDIEEHDVMDNPKIKRIFPDLSVIKKEINDYNYDEDLKLSTETVPKEDLDQADTMKDSKEDVLNYIQNSNDLVATSPFHASDILETQKVSGRSYENIIILGTKPNFDCEKNNHTSIKKEPRVTVENISSFLNSCKRYCKICLILFPKANIFNLHRLHIHTEKTLISRMGRKVSRLFKCNVCDKSLSSQKTLWTHFTNFHGDVKASWSIKSKTIEKSDSKIVANEASPNLKLSTETVPKEDLDQADTMKDSKEDVLNYIQNSNDLVATSPFHASDILETQKVSGRSYENIIILGTKPNFDCEKNNHTSIKKEPRVTVENISSFLNSCKRYCKICLILFPKANIFNLHRLHIHTEKTLISRMGRKVSSLFKCNVCDKSLSSQKTLWTHFTNLHGDVKASWSIKSKTIEKSDSKIVANEASPSKASTGFPCFHCKQLFPRQSSLIEHLYEVLEPNKIEPSVNANSTNAKQSKKEVLNDGVRVNNLNDSKASFKSNVVVTNSPHSSHKDNTDKSNSPGNQPQTHNLRRPSLDSVIEHGNEYIKTKKRKSNSEPVRNGDTQLKKIIKTKQCNEFTEKVTSKTEMKSAHIEKSNITNKMKMKPRKETNNLISSKEPSHSKFYKCFICSKYNVTFKFYSLHMMNDHNIQEVTPVKKVPFDSQCKFCPLKCSEIKSYNVHLHTYHKELQKRTYLPCEEQLNNKNRIEVDIRKQFALKSILYKCMQCDLYFLSSNSALDHSKHLGITDTWKCTACQRNFSKENMVLHEKQHTFSQTFIVYSITESVFNRLLYKCSNCTVHFTEISFFHHFLKCGSDTPNSLYCKVCDIIINRDDMEGHGLNHKEKKLQCCDFIIIEPDMDGLQSPNTNETTNNESNVIDGKLLMPDTNKKINEASDMIEKRRGSQKTSIKIIRKSEIDGSNSAKKKKIQSDSVDRRFRRLNRTKTKNKIVKRYVNSRFRNEGLLDYSRFALSFCHTCKCFIGNMHLRKLHVEGKCGHMLKLVCKGCGLLLTTKTHETHKENHKKKQISLNDYLFYDLKTGKQICPPIPEYPKCNSCGVRFLRNFHVKTHACQYQDYITCNVCFMKLTEDAYKLHVNFHSYAIPSVSTKLQKKALQENSADEVSYVERNSNVSDHYYVIDFYYTCKSCQLTVNTYDAVVQHCHDHYDSDVVQLHTQKCPNCTLILQISDYKSHLNGRCNNDSIKVVDFDPFYFHHNNDFWTKHIFAYVADEDIIKILRSSIYRYECRLKMETIQFGSSNSVLYKCDKCNVFIDPKYLYIHAVNMREKYCEKLRNHPCALCGLCFSSNAYKTAHEKEHESIEMTLKSHKVVLYNKEEHESYNKVMYDASYRYILHQCRNCERVVDKFDRNAHNCDKTNLKLCSSCGLLIDKHDFDLHFIRHEELDKFDIENIIVVKFGKPQLCYQSKNKLSSTFNGTKYDYSMYKCMKCGLCLSTKKCISKHICVFDSSKCKCSKCGLYFTEMDFKTHFKIHDSNLNFDELSMNIITIDPASAGLPDDLNGTLGENNDLDKQSEVTENTSVSPEKREVIYKCDCGLHFLEEGNAQQHANSCNSRMKISKQNCVKCDLLFTPGELFNHLLKHHCDKKLQFKFDLVHVSANEKQ